MNIASGAITSASARSWAKVPNAVSNSRSVLAFRILSCSPSVRAVDCKSLDIVSAIKELVGLTRSATIFAVGTSSRSSSSRFGPSSVFKFATPVTLPPGRARLATSPATTGSDPIWKTMGIVAVAAFAASAAGVLPAQQLHSLDGEPNRPPMPAIDHSGRPPNGIRS